MKAFAIGTALAATCVAAVPINIERAPLLDGLAGILGNEPVTMLKALPDKNIDPSPLGIDNIVANLPLPDLDLLKRDPEAALDLDDILDDRATSPTSGGAAKYSSFIPFDKSGSPVGPQSKPNGGLVAGLPLVGDLTKGTPLAPLKSLLGSAGGGGLLKARVFDPKESSRSPNYTGADELNDQTDEPNWY